jgi:hypothetical protein
MSGHCPCKRVYMTILGLPRQQRFLCRIGTGLLQMLHGHQNINSSSHHVGHSFLPTPDPVSAYINHHRQNNSLPQSLDCCHTSRSHTGQLPCPNPGSREPPSNLQHAHNANQPTSCPENSYHNPCINSKGVTGPSASSNPGINSKGVHADPSTTSKGG